MRFCALKIQICGLFRDLVIFMSRLLGTCLVWLQTLRFWPGIMKNGCHGVSKQPFGLCQVQNKRSPRQGGGGRGAEPPEHTRMKNYSKSKIKEAPGRAGGVGGRSPLNIQNVKKSEKLFFWENFQQLPKVHHAGVRIKLESRGGRVKSS